MDFNEDEIGIKSPAFAICMEPKWKKEILEKYNITSGFFMLQKGSFEHLKDKKTMKEIITEASFRINKDFNIAITILGLILNSLWWNAKASTDTPNAAVGGGDIRVGAKVNCL